MYTANVVLSIHVFLNMNFNQKKSARISNTFLFLCIRARIAVLNKIINKQTKETFGNI